LVGVIRRNPRTQIWQPKGQVESSKWTDAAPTCRGQPEETGPPGRVDAELLPTQRPRLSDILASPSRETPSHG
jgi:hypothetical protein